MANVFISYKRDERSQITQLAEMLRAIGLSVWFDASLSAGESFNDEIDREANVADVILVCWSQAARESMWVKAEALLGFEQNKLAACYVAGEDKFSPPAPFNAVHTEDLRAWLTDPDETASGWKSLLRRIGKLCGREDIESFGALDVQASVRELRDWLERHPGSPLIPTVEDMIALREVEEAERERFARDSPARRQIQETQQRIAEAALLNTEEPGFREKLERASKLKGQPAGFWLLVLMIFGERFAYFGMRGLLVIFMLDVIMTSQQQIYVSYGGFIGLGYLMVLVAGLLSDLVFGPVRSLRIGGIVSIVGFAGMVIASSPVMIDIPDLSVMIIFASLSGIAIGSSFLRIGLPLSLGGLYEELDPRRNSGFTLYYAALNVAAFLASLICGYVGQSFGWMWGFGAAGLGMLVCWVAILAGSGRLSQVEALQPPGRSAPVIGAILAALALIVPGAIMVRHGSLISNNLPTLVSLPIVAIALYGLIRYSGQDRARILIGFGLSFIAAFYWMFFEITGFTLQTFSERFVDLSLVPGQNSAMTQTFSAIFIILLALPLALSWAALARRLNEPTAPVKFALALIFLGLGFAATILFVSNEPQLPISALIVLYLLHAFGELMLVPTGLSMMAQMPRGIRGLMMAVWTVATVYTFLLATTIAPGTASLLNDNGTETSPEAFARITRELIQIGIWGLIAGLFLLLLSPVLRRWGRS